MGKKEKYLAKLIRARLETGGSTFPAGRRDGG